MYMHIIIVIIIIFVGKIWPLITVIPLFSCRRYNADDKLAVEDVNITANSMCVNVTKIDGCLCSCARSTIRSGARFIY